MLIELVCMGLLALAAISGVMVLFGCWCQFRDYRNKDLIALYWIDGAALEQQPFLAGTFIGTGFSTAISFYDLYLRLAWILEIGLSSVGEKWALHWLTLHSAIAILFLLYHRFVWQMCRAIEADDEE